MIKPRDFEDYLMTQFAMEEPCVLDDEFPDAYDEWLCGLEPDTWIEYGEKYAKLKNA